MKNSEMKVDGLLNEKSEIESKLNCLGAALKSIKGEIGSSDHNFKDNGTASVYAPSQEYRFEIDRDLIQFAVEKKIERLEAELEPIAKKLEAIELMLNS